MSTVGQHGGCFACARGHGEALWSTSDQARIRRALERAGRPATKAPADSVALCPPCYGEDELIAIAAEPTS